MRLLFTLSFWLVFLSTAPLAFLFSLGLWAVTAPFDASRAGVHRFICLWTHGYLKLCPLWDVKVLERERLPPGPSVLVANHQSMADIAAVMGLSHPFKFVSKASLFSLPVVGWVMRLASYVRVERGQPHSTQKMMEDCRAWLRRGVAVLLFPEGTYSSDGRLLPFKRGAFRLAIEEQVPLVPVLIQGTSDLIQEDGPWLNPRCRVRVTVLPGIPPSELGPDDQELARRVRRLFAQQLEQSVE